MTFAAFSRPWPSEPPAFSFEERPSQFTAYEDYYQEPEPTEHQDEEYEPDPIFMLAKQHGASDELASHLAQVFNDAGGHKPVEEADPASLHIPQDVPHYVADTYNKSWTHRKPAVQEIWPTD